MTEGFAGEILSGLPTPDLAESLRTDLRSWLQELPA